MANNISEKPTLRQALRGLKGDIAGQLAIDRTGIIRRSAPVQMRIAAWVAIASMFGIGWGIGTRNALAILLGWVPLPTDRPIGTASEELTQLLVSLAVTVAAGVFIWTFRQEAGARPAPVTWRTSIQTFPVAILATSTGFIMVALVSTALNLPAYTFGIGETTDPTAEALEILNAGMAGPSEELALLALVVVALRSTGHSWITVGIVAVIVRVPFHLYYGWGAVGLSVWAVLMVLLYKRTGAIVAIAAAHATFNMLNYLGDLGQMLKLLLALIGIAIVWWRMIRNINRREKATAAQNVRTIKENHAHGHQ